MALDPSSVSTLSQLIKVAEIRHRVTSQNISNVNTPGYQAREVNFEAELARQLRSGSASAQIPTPSIDLNQAASTRLDGNNVDLDREVGLLNKNALLHQTYTQVMASYFDSMRRAMRTG